MKVLFVCAENTCRGPMAEAYLRYLLEKEKITNITVSSAGILNINLARPVSKLTQKIISKYTQKKIQHISKIINREMIQNNNIILTMTKHQKNILIDKYPDFRYKIFTLYEYTHQIDQDIFDPIGKDYSDYEKVFYLIRKGLDAFITKIKGEYLAG